MLEHLQYDIKFATNSDSFESATTYFFRCPDDLGNSKWRKKVVAHTGTRD